MDDNQNRKLELEEFRKGLTEYGLGFSKDEINQMFTMFDRDGSGTIDFDEFLENLRVCLFLSYYQAKRNWAIHFSFLSILFILYSLRCQKVE